MPRPELSPLNPHSGVEVSGIDLAAVDDGTWVVIRSLFEDHSALLFRDQRLDDDAHLAFGRQFRRIEDRNADERPAGAASTVPRVSTVREDGTLAGALDTLALHRRAVCLFACLAAATC